jgi:hypothetical protein
VRHGRPLLADALLQVVRPRAREARELPRWLGFMTLLAAAACSAAGG